MQKCGSGPSQSHYRCVGAAMLDTTDTFTYMCKLHYVFDTLSLFQTHMFVCMYVCMYILCMYVCTVCMYVCMYVCTSMPIPLFTWISLVLTLPLQFLLASYICLCALYCSYPTVSTLLPLFPLLPFLLPLPTPPSPSSPLLSPSPHPVALPGGWSGSTPH